jgi:uncharacterized protein (TIGR03663 family)
MAEALFPQPQSTTTWLDRPVAPSWQRLTALFAYWEIAAYSALVTVAFLLRIWDLGYRALHHDESLHAYYAWQLFAGRGYAYDPLMHGPLKFEMTAFFYLLFGDNEFAARLFPALIGTALIVLPYFLRHHLTRTGALALAAFLTISPTFLYFSRFIRDDVPLAFFSFLLFICVVRYLESHQNRFIYIGAAVMALAMASMEAAYITFFLFGLFLAFAALREFLNNRDGPVIAAFKATSLDTWVTAIAIFVGIIVVLYSTFFTNPYGIWDTRYGLTDPNRKDILGGLLYWKEQHSVQRGGQPWFYYLLVLPLYEQIAVIFGVAGAIYACLRRSLFATFAVWWAAGSLLMYSWAGEKMPWLSMHITLPLLVLAGYFIGRLHLQRRQWVRIAVGGVLGVLLVLEVHSAFALSYQDPANPTEMLIYVQTSQDVPNVTHEIDQIAARTGMNTTLPIGLDDADVGGWPFVWYLRHYTAVFDTSTFSGPACGEQYCPVLLMLGPEYDQYSKDLDKHYVAQQYRWNWWFPEDYKVWFPDHVGTIALALAGKGSLAPAPIGTPTDWQHLWDWMVYRQPFGERGARQLYFLVRRDLVPGSKDFSNKPPPVITVPSSPAPASSFAVLPSSLRSSLGAGGGLSGPRGAATDRQGNVFVADPAAHRVVEFSASGRLIRSWGTVGNRPGQFAQLDSPQGIAVGPDGNIFVADTWNQRIQVFTPTGQFVRQWGEGPIGSGTGQFYGPRSIAIDSAGHVIVADTGNERIQEFSSSGAYLGSWGVRGTAAGEFSEPSSVAVGPHDLIYVSDFWNQRVQVFTSAGRYVRSWSVPDWTPHSYDEPYLAVDARTGTVYASEPQQQRVVAWTSVGQPLGAFGTGQLTLPSGVAVEPGGQVVVSDATGARVQVFRVRGKARG